MSTHPTVTARIAVLAAQAAERVARLEALERQTPNLAGTSNARLTLARKLKEARAESASWGAMVDLATEDSVRLSTALDAASATGPEFGGPDHVDGWNACVQFIREFSAPQS